MKKIGDITVMDNGMYKKQTGGRKQWPRWKKSQKRKRKEKKKQYPSEQTHLQT